MATRPKKLIIGASVIILLLAVIVVFVFFGPGPTQNNIRTTGNISAADVAELQPSLRSFRRREILPDLSWRSLHNLPSGIKKYFTPIDSIRASRDGTYALVIVSPPSDNKATTNGMNIVFDDRTGSTIFMNSLLSSMEAYLVKKTPTGWVVSAHAEAAPNAVVILQPSTPGK